MKNIKRNSENFLLKTTFTALLLLLFIPVSAQEDQEKAAREATKFLQQAEEALAESDFPAAEAHYRKAIAKDPENAAARFNMGNLYYNKEIAGQAVERHTQAAAVTADKVIKHNSFHNTGNAFMKQKKYKEAVEAYKNALRNDPSDDETRYNLALAKKLLEEQNQDQKKDQQKENKDQQGDKGENKEDKEGDPKEQKEGGEKENKEKKEGEDKKGDEGKPQDEKKNEGANEKKEQQQKQPVPGQLSPQQVKNLLEAMGNEEKKIQDRINERKAKGAKVQTAKDW